MNAAAMPSRSARAAVAGRSPRPAASARTPPQPGQFLESRFMKPLGITQTELAEALQVSRRRVNELIRGRRAITADTAIRLGLFFGNDATFWMHLQVAWDMHEALKRHRAARRAAR